MATRMVALQFRCTTRNRVRSIAILETALAGFFGAMRAAKNFAAGFHAVPDHFALTMWTSRRQHMNGALETVEGMSFSSRRNLKRLVIVVSANIALSHNASWLSSTKFRLCVRKRSRVGTQASGLCAQRACCTLLAFNCGAGASPAILNK